MPQEVFGEATVILRVNNSEMLDYETTKEIEFQVSLIDEYLRVFFLSKYFNAYSSAAATLNNPLHKIIDG